MVFIKAFTLVWIFLNKLKYNKYGGLLYNRDTYLFGKKVEVTLDLLVSSRIFFLPSNKTVVS